MPGGDGIPGGGERSRRRRVPGGLGGASGEVDPNTLRQLRRVGRGREAQGVPRGDADLEKHDRRRPSRSSRELHDDGQRARHDRRRLQADGDQGHLRQGLGRVQRQPKVAVKGKAALKIKYKPAVCSQRRGDGRSRREVRRQGVGRRRRDVLGHLQRQVRRQCGRREGRHRRHAAAASATVSATAPATASAKVTPTSRRRVSARRTRRSRRRPR